MPITRIGRLSNIEPELQAVRPERAVPASTRGSTSESDSATALAELWQMRNERRGLAASRMVTGIRDGFKDASETLSDITRDDPNDWRAHSCRALIAWHNGTDDHDALRALRKADPAQAEFLLKIHEIVEQSLKADPFSAPSIPKKANPAIVVPGKQLTSTAEMDGDLLDRLKAALKLANTYPDAPIVLSGGATVTQTTECSVMAKWLIEQGISPDRLLLDPLATVTTANALQAIALLRKHPGTDQILLVTDEDHIRRAYVIFSATLMRSDLRATLTPVPAEGSKAGKLGQPADEKVRAKVFLDAMHACGLFAFRGQPRFYQRGNVIGDALPGDPKAAVEVALPERRAAGAADDAPEFVAINRMDRGELPRGAESLLLERLLRAHGKLPKAFRLKRGATQDQQRVVIDTIEALGLKYSHTEQAANYVQLCVEPLSAAVTAESAFAATVDAPPSEWVPRDPVVDGRQVRPADQRYPARSNAAAPRRGPARPLVIGEPRFLVSHDGSVHLNGSIHAVDLDAVRKQPTGAFDVVRIQFGPKNWNEPDLMKLGREGARLLRANGRLLVSTGAEPHAPIAAFIKALTKHDFSVGISTPVETAFYPVMSDPSAGGVTFECKMRPQSVRKRARESSSSANGPTRSKVRGDD